MNKISFDTAKNLWNNLNTIESALLGYEIDSDFHTIFEKKLQTNDKITNKTSLLTKAPSIQKDSIENASTFYKKLQSCTRCALHHSRKQAIEGRGVKNPLVLVITEAPNEADDSAGTPMTGEAGKLLEKMLFAIGLSEKENTYITPIIKCKPPENKLPLLEQMYACKSFLDIQIQKQNPSFILALGSITSLALLGPRQNFQDIRGKVFDYKVSTIQDKTIPLLITYSPHSLLHDEALKRPAWQDLKVVRNILDTIQKGQNL